MSTDDDYVLGTHDDEIARLGLQHRVWRPMVLDCWQRAGLTVGKRVLDLGAGPGYATVDLAEIVGPEGEVTAVERSSKFVGTLQERVRTRALTNVKIHELDLMTDNLPPGGYDFSWCRWVLSFVPDPARVIRQVGEVLRKGGVAIFHEYGAYQTWGFMPPRPYQQEFVQHIVETWRETGGKADIAGDLLPLLLENDFVFRSIKPHIYCIRPADHMWQWPATFIQSGPTRLQELGRIDESFAKNFRAEFAGMEKDPNSIMLTPMVLEIVAERRR